jgi:hypothetical protein
MDILKNHERFKEASDSLEKLKIAYKNALIAFNASVNNIEELKDIALKIGYEFNEATGELIKYSRLENKVHELKIKQEFAKEYYSGKKQWEIRKNDRDFRVGDEIIFTIIETGYKYSRQIIYVFDGVEYGLEKGYCILSLSGYKYCL